VRLLFLFCGMSMMNEKQQNRTIDYYVNKCPMFRDYLSSYHNMEIKTSPSRTLCEIDDLYIYKDYILVGENKIRDSKGCHKKMESQIKRMKRYENAIKRKLGICTSLPVYYFYAHFDNEKTHIEYEGVKESYKK